MRNGPARWERVRDLLLARAGQWIDDAEFYGPGGRDAWRTRISDARKWARLHGGEIENRLIREPWGVRSQYRYVKPQPVGQLALWEAR